MRISDWSSDVCSSDLILTPQAIPNLLVSVDYYNIKVDNYIGTVDPFLTINQCIQTGNPFFCDLFNRDPATGVIFGTNEIGRASGRARVCQSGYISGVAVTLKKKPTQ